MMEMKQKPSSAPSRAKILMLHGHGQSGQFFQCKTQFLQPRVERILLTSLWKSYRQHLFDTIDFYYPSGVFPANPDHPRDENISMWAWGYGDVEVDRIRGLETSVDYILRFLEAHGPFIGVMGFSTGAAVAAIISSLLEKRRSIGGFSFNTNHPPLEFAVSFSGFPLEHPLYSQIYSPKIQTPMLHVIGTMDTMIDESQSLKLRDACTNPTLYYFFGTHYVPRSEDLLDTLALFFENVLKNGERKEEEWEDLES